MRVVIFTQYRSHTYAFLAHLLARGVPVTHIVFEGPMCQGFRERLLRICEGALLWLEHVLYRRAHPLTYLEMRSRHGSIETLLQSHQISWIHVTDHNDPECVSLLSQIAPDILVLYGTRIIKPTVLAVPVMGTLNIHSSLLPTFRGGKSEFWILSTGQHDRFGVTVHWVEPSLDSGPIVLQERLPVFSEDTPATLREKAQWLAPVLLAEALRRLAQGEKLCIAQDLSSISIYRAPTAAQIQNYQRAFPGKPVF